MKTFKISAILISAFIILSLNSCNNSSNKNQPEGTHVHDDGSVHESHTDETKSTTPQESFQVEADTTVTQPEKKDDHGHDHSDPNHKH
ncbi:MAG: hypothetical protein Q8S23_04800 [Bacteroidales bacterium]|jgi:hypothetical protein|nr:hypothetical protein [Bacteroidales bacterium]